MQRVTIGELERRGAIVAIQDGNHGELHPKASEYVEKGVPFVMASDVRDCSVWLNSCKYLTKDHADQLRIGFAKTGDVLLTHKGTVGEVAIVPRVDDYVMLTPQVTYYRTNASMLCNRYLAFAFRSSFFQQQLASVAGQLTRPYIGITAQRHLQVEYCDIGEQHRIVSVLSSYDDLIQNNTRRIAVLEEMGRCIYDKWFVHFGYARDNHGQTIGSGRDVLPDGWRRGTLNDVADRTSERYVDERHAQLPLVDLARIPRRSNALVAVGSSNDITTSRTVFRQGSVLFGAIRPNLHKVLFTPFDGVSNVSVHNLVPKAPFGSAFLFFTAFADTTIAWAVQHAGGMKMPTINWDVLASMPIIVAGVEVASMFETVALPMLHQISALVRTNMNLRITRDILLPRLISGEMDVSNLAAVSA